jgi:hypothetical protein
VGGGTRTAKSRPYRGLSADASLWAPINLTDTNQ